MLTTFIRDWGLGTGGAETGGEHEDLVRVAATRVALSGMRASARTLPPPASFQVAKLEDHGTN
jgi:hypothetical protein